jgi:tripartite-type tricarboxylate transporter receptor subunit TctC
MIGAIRLLVVAIALVAGNAAAQGFTSNPLTLLCNCLPGSVTHLYAQGFAKIAAKYLGKPVNLELASPGGGVTRRFVESATRDGHSLFVHSINAFRIPYQENVSWHPVKDFTYVIALARFEFGVVVKADSKFRTIGDVVEYARANPSKFVYATSSHGQTQHLAMEDLAYKTGVRFVSVHGTFEQSARALAEGRVMAIAESTVWGPYVDSGAFRLLVTFGEARSRWKAPTARESGFDVLTYSPVGIVAPKGVDPARVKILHDAFNRALDDPEYDRLLRQFEMVDWYKSGDDYADWAVDQFEFQRALLKRTIGLKRN